jgi:hypothetical protein
VFLLPLLRVWQVSRNVLEYAGQELKLPHSGEMSKTHSVCYILIKSYHNQNLISDAIISYLRRVLCVFVRKYGFLATSLEADGPDRQNGQNWNAAGHVTSVTAKPPAVEGFVYPDCILSVSDAPVQRLQRCYGNTPLLPTCK